jgi:hypothetical protein
MFRGMAWSDSIRMPITRKLYQRSRKQLPIKWNYVCRMVGNTIFSGVMSFLSPKESWGTICIYTYMKRSNLATVLLLKTLRTPGLGRWTQTFRFVGVSYRSDGDNSRSIWTPQGTANVNLSWLRHWKGYKLLISSWTISDWTSCLSTHESLKSSSSERGHRRKTRQDIGNTKEYQYEKYLIHRRDQTGLLSPSVLVQADLAWPSSDQIIVPPPRLMNFLKSPGLFSAFCLYTERFAHHCGFYFAK